MSNNAIPAANTAPPDNDDCFTLKPHQYHSAAPTPTCSTLSLERKRGRDDDNKSPLVRDSTRMALSVCAAMTVAEALVSAPTPREIPACMMASVLAPRQIVVVHMEVGYLPGNGRSDVEHSFQYDRKTGTMDAQHPGILFFRQYGIRSVIAWGDDSADWPGLRRSLNEDRDGYLIRRRGRTNVAMDRLKRSKHWSRLKRQAYDVAQDLAQRLQLHIEKKYISHKLEHGGARKTHMGRIKGRKRRFLYGRDDSKMERFSLCHLETAGPIEVVDTFKYTLRRGALCYTDVEGYDDDCDLVTFLSRAQEHNDADAAVGNMYLQQFIDSGNATIEALKTMELMMKKKPREGFGFPGLVRLGDADRQNNTNDDCSTSDYDDGCSGEEDEERVPFRRVDKPSRLASVVAPRQVVIFHTKKGGHVGMGWECAPYRWTYFRLTNGTMDAQHPGIFFFRQYGIRSVVAWGDDSLDWPEKRREYGDPGGDGEEEIESYGEDTDGAIGRLKGFEHWSRLKRQAYDVAQDLAQHLQLHIVSQPEKNEDAEAMTAQGQTGGGRKKKRKKLPLRTDVPLNHMKNVAMEVCNTFIYTLETGTMCKSDVECDDHDGNVCNGRCDLATFLASLPSSLEKVSTEALSKSAPEGEAEVGQDDETTKEEKDEEEAEVCLRQFIARAFETLELLKRMEATMVEQVPTRFPKLVRLGKEGSKNNQCSNNEIDYNAESDMEESDEDDTESEVDEKSNKDVRFRPSCFELPDKRFQHKATLAHTLYAFVLFDSAGPQHEAAVSGLAMLSPDVTDLPSFVVMMTEMDEKRVQHGLWSIRKLCSIFDVKGPIVFPDAMSATTSDTLPQQPELHILPSLLAAILRNAALSQEMISVVLQTIYDVPIDVRARDVLLDEAAEEIAHGMSLTVLHSPTDRMLQMTATVAHQLVQSKPFPPLEKTRRILRTLGELVRKLDKNRADQCIQKTLREAFLAIRYISDGGSSRVYALLGTGLLPHAVELLHRYPDDPEMQMPALCVIGNVFSGSYDSKAVALATGFLSLMAPLIRSTDQNLRKEAVWTLSNVAAVDQDKINSGLLEIIVKESLVDTFLYVRIEAVWVVHNIAIALGGTLGQVATMVDTYSVLDKLHDVIKASTEILEDETMKRTVGKLVVLVFKTLGNFIRRNSSWRVDLEESLMQKLQDSGDSHIMDALASYTSRDSGSSNNQCGEQEQGWPSYRWLSNRWPSCRNRTNYEESDEEESDFDDDHEEEDEEESDVDDGQDESGECDDDEDDNEEDE